MASSTVRVMDCKEPWYSLLRTGVKPVEGRKATPRWSDMKVGEIFIIRNNDDHKLFFNAKITRINIYPAPGALNAYLEGETLSRTLPGIDTIEDAIKAYSIIGSNDDIDNYGMMGITILVV